MFKNGKRVGLHKEWYESDQLKSENYYSDYNEENPFQREWYQSGQLKSELYPKRYKEWYESGQLKIDGKYNDVIKDETCVREWYENGRLKSEEFYKKDVLNGLHREWYENGSSKYECNYERGCKIGLEKEWYKSNTKQVSYIHGVRTDGFISQLKREKNYSDCLFYLQKVWYENGQLKSEETYDNGVLIEEK